MHIQSLDPFGAEVTDVNLNRLSDHEFDAIWQAFIENGVVFIRDQELSESDHIAFAERFGDINVNRFFAAHPDYPKIALVTKEPHQEQNIGGDWHTDHSYDQEPALGSILVAREVPEKGGDTIFASMYQTIERLSPGLLAMLEQLSAVHSARHVFGSQMTASRTDRIGNAETADVLPDPIHPVVIRHPLSGKKALYINPQFTLHIAGWTPRESQPLMDYLFALATEEDQLCRFRWHAGSVAVWDNRATWHSAANDYSGSRREMHRITLEGCALTAVST